jgi:uncharacterized membrane protein YesL
MNYLNQRENPGLFWISKIGDFCALSVLWILLCLPIVTFIPASIALFDSVAHCLHGSEDGPVQRFFCTLKAELGRGILLSLVWLSVGFGLVFGFNILFQMSQENQALGPYALVYLFTALIPVSILAWVIPVQSRFEHSFFGLFRSSAVYAIAHLPTTIMLLVILIVTVLAIWTLPVLALMLPAIAVTIQCWFIERVFQKYIPQEDKNDE